MYLLNLSLRPWKMAPFSQLLSAVAVGFLLILSCSLFWMQTSLKPLISKLKAEQVVTIYLSNLGPQQTEAQWIDKIQMNLGSHSQAEVKYVGISDFISLIHQQYPSLARELEDLGQEVQQVVPRYISIAGILSTSAVEALKKMPGIENIESSQDRYHHIVGAFSVLRWIAKILIVGVCFALLVGMVHLSRINAHLHRDVLKLLRYWGAGRWTLMLPGVIAGASVGFLGGLLAGLAWVSLGKVFIFYVQSLSEMFTLLPETQTPFAWILVLTGTLLGVLSGMLGRSSGGYAS